ncbi:MAG TPA: HD domain-containing phosphohydrolase [Thermoanaerobaculia bacterium]|nr:HD domain-containing phosphohydrolase [Thermoanaerobaculia bacterium]
MHPDVEELKPKLKEILYDCAVIIRATRAALYVFDDGANRFELVTEFGFRGAIRPFADFNDPIVDRCGRGRTPFFVNGLAVEPRFSQILFEASTDRLLAVPLYSRGKLIGIIDIRDKSGKQPFDNEDVVKAQNIAERMIDVFGDRNLFGHRFIVLSDVDRTFARAPEPSEPAVATAPTVAPVAARATARTHVPRLAALVIEARTAASRVLVPSTTEALSESDVMAARDVLRSILLIPGAVAATFSAFGHIGGVEEIAARSTITEEAQRLIQSKLKVWLTKRGERGGSVRTSVTTPLGTSTATVTPVDIQKVFTAPVHVGTLHGLYLTVVFAGNPDRVAHELLAVLHTHLQLVIEQSMQRGATAAMQVRVAEKLLEPDFTRYPELRRHSDLVSRLCETFARHLGLTSAEVETARMAGLVHDCGLRLLDYDRLYRKRDMTAEELAFLREHPAVGAAMIEPVLGASLARIVLCHHERVDGRGYPNELHGEAIPLLSRLLQLCDAWVAMTDPDTYQQPVSRDSALANLTRGAGSQFDPELIGKFIEMVRPVR